MQIPQPCVPPKLCMFTPCWRYSTAARYLPPCDYSPLPQSPCSVPCYIPKWWTGPCTHRSSSGLPSRSRHPGQRAATYCSWWYARVPAVCASTGHLERDSEREGHTLVRGARQVPVPYDSFCRPCCSFSSGAQHLQAPTHEQLDRIVHFCMIVDAMVLDCG